MTVPVAHYNETLERAIDVFRLKPFSFAQIAVEGKVSDTPLHEALDALVADGLLTVISVRPTIYRVTKFI